MVRVAIIDDYPSIREALTFTLESAGFVVFAFRTGEEFLAGVRSIDPACVVMDVSLPGLTGFAVLKALGGRDCPFPVILTTGSSDETFPSRAAEAGAWSSIQKPFDADRVVGAVRAALKNRTDGPSQM